MKESRMQRMNEKVARVYFFASLSVCLSVCFCPTIKGFLYYTLLYRSHQTSYHSIVLWAREVNSNASVELVMTFTSSRILQSELSAVSYLRITLHITQVVTFVGTVINLTGANGSSWTLHKLGGRIHRPANIDEVMEMFVLRSGIDCLPVTLKISQHA